MTRQISVMIGAFNTCTIKYQRYSLVVDRRCQSARGSKWRHFPIPESAVKSKRNNTITNRLNAVIYDRFPKRIADKPARRKSDAYKLSSISKDGGESSRSSAQYSGSHQYVNRVSNLHKITLC